MQMPERHPVLDEALSQIGEEQRWQIREIAEQTKRLRSLFCSIGKSCDMTNALVNLDQAAMWATKHVTDRSA